jgi:hypothetical protein
MTNAIATGSILVAGRAYLPKSVQLRSEPDSNGWITLDGAMSTFENDIQADGWTFFFMAGEIKTTVFGFDRQKTLCTALQRLITNVKSHNCNGIEITQVTAHSFCKVPNVSVSAHARHLQKGSTFSGQSLTGSI